MTMVSSAYICAYNRALSMSGIAFLGVHWEKKRTEHLTQGDPSAQQ